MMCHNLKLAHSTPQCDTNERNVANNYKVVVQQPLWVRLTHRCRVTHICVDKLTIIGSDNGLLPGRRQRKNDALQWRHYGCDNASNHQPHDCLLNRLFRRRSRKTSKLRVTSEFPAQMTSNVENVSIWWRNNGILQIWWCTSAIAFDIYIYIYILYWWLCISSR